MCGLEREVTHPGTQSQHHRTPPTGPPTGGRDGQTDTGPPLCFLEASPSRHLPATFLSPGPPASLTGAYRLQVAAWRHLNTSPGGALSQEPLRGSPSDHRRVSPGSRKLPARRLQQTGGQSRPHRKPASSLRVPQLRDGPALIHPKKRIRSGWRL